MAHILRNDRPTWPKYAVWLKPADPHTLSAKALQILTATSGIPKENWPDHIQQGLALARSKGQGDPNQIAEILSQWISKDGPYLYSSRAEKHGKEFDQAMQQISNLSGKVPLALLLSNLKMFNCDGAALIGATLLRDFFKIPTRIAGGYTSSTDLLTPKKDVLHAVNLRDPKHAWVEVFVDGKWKPFDFTPKNNSPDPQAADLLTRPKVI